MCVCVGGHIAWSWKWGDGGSWGYLAFPVPARHACLLVPNEVLDYFNERTESIIIIISKGKRGSKQLCALAGFTLVAPFDQRRQRGFRGARAHTHTNPCLLAQCILHVALMHADTHALPKRQNYKYTNNHLQSCEGHNLHWGWRKEETLKWL